MPRRAAHGLGSLQAEVMELIWQLGEATVTQLHKRISRRRDVTYTTVLVAAQKLEKKGWLAHRTEGRAYVYRAARTRELAAKGVVRDIVDTFFAGDAQLLLSHLLDEHPMSQAELTELRRLIEARRKEPSHE